MNLEKDRDIFELRLIEEKINTLKKDFDQNHSIDKAGKLTFLYDMIAACKSEIVQSMTLNLAAESLGVDMEIALREFKAAQKRGTKETNNNQERPNIEIKGGLLPLIVAQAEDVLAATEGIYQRGGMLVRITKTQEKSSNKKIYRAGGSINIQPIEPLWMAKELTKKARWCKYDERIKGLKEIDCPKLYAATLLANGDWKLPTLRGIIEAPTLRNDGSILNKRGFDPETNLFFDAEPTLTFPEIPDSPSQKDAIEALGVLTFPLAQFPFEKNEDFSVAISAILTSLIRKSLRSAPLHAFSAPKMRSGKTLLAHIVAQITTGRSAAVINQAENEEEERKRLLALLMEGDEVIVIDNITGTFKSNVLCSVLTEEFWKERVLGSNKTCTVPTNAMFMATGNNLSLTGDLSSRTLLCYLDPQCEHPEEREFETNLEDWIPAHRGELITAGLTILRGFHCAGRPKQDIKRYGGFDEWSDWVRAAIVWCGMPDPCKTRVRVEEGDSEREMLGNLLSDWHESLGEAYFYLKDVISGASNNQNLKEALLAIAGNREGGIDAAKLGYYLRSFVNREESGLKLMKKKKTAHGVSWGVRGVKRFRDVDLEQLNL